MSNRSSYLQNDAPPSRVAETEKPARQLAHLDYLDGLRALAAIYVVVCHANLQVDPLYLTAPDVWHGGGIVEFFRYGRYAVDVFIVLSGFCLMMPVVRGDGTIRGGALGFLKRRAWRILPPYYLAGALSVALSYFVLNAKTGMTWDACIPVTWKSLVTHLLMFPEVFGEDHSVNYVFWSVAVEWRIYFLFPLLVWVWERAGAYITMTSTVVISYLLFRLFEKTFNITFTINYLGLFAMGMFAADVVYARSASMAKVRAFPWWLGVLGGMILLGFMQYKQAGRLQGPPRQHVFSYVVGATAAALLIVVSLKKQHPLTRALSWRPLAFLGAFAYSIYLIHAPLLQLLWLAMPFLHARPWAMFSVLAILGTPLIVGASYLFFLFCERPFLHLKRKDALIAKTALEPAP